MKKKKTTGAYNIYALCNNIIRLIMTFEMNKSNEFSQDNE